MNSNWILKLCDIMALLDSTCYKISNGILFVIFWIVVWKIWFSKVLTKNRFENWIRILFRSETDTWRNGICWYRFGWITNVGRRILRRSNAQDRSVPFHFSDLLGSLDQDPTVKIKRERERVPRVRFPAWKSSEAARRRAPATFWRFLYEGKGTSRFGVARRARGFDRRRRLRPEWQGRSGWSGSRRRWVSGELQYAKYLQENDVPRY
jgi:hypothetical protein